MSPERRVRVLYVPHPVHELAGYEQCGDRWRARCTCGWATHKTVSPAASEAWFFQHAKLAIGSLS